MYLRNFKDSFRDTAVVIFAIFLAAFAGKVISGARLVLLGLVAILLESRFSWLGTNEVKALSAFVQRYVSFRHPTPSGQIGGDILISALGSWRGLKGIVRFICHVGEQLIWHDTLFINEFALTLRVRK